MARSHVPQSPIHGIGDVKDRMYRNSTMCPIISKCFMKQMKDAETTFFNRWRKLALSERQELKDLVYGNGVIGREDLRLASARGD
jgi:hypothetical protein